MGQRRPTIRRLVHDGVVVVVTPHQVINKRRRTTVVGMVVALTVVILSLNFEIVASVETNSLRRLNDGSANFEGLFQEYDARKRPSNARIVGGSPAALGDYPFYAHSLQPILCGATLIYEDILLTAAHCGGGFLAGAALGGIMLDGSDGSIVSVDREFPNPTYSDKTRENDIMLVKLTDPILDVTPVTLNQNSAIPAVNETVTVIGFGDTADGGAVSNILLQVDVDAYSDQFCEGLFTVYDPSTMVCAGTVQGGRDSCQGDSGGPLFAQNNIQVGIVSTGDGCGKPNVPAVYTEVAAFQTFIRQGICDLSGNPPSSCNVPTAGPTVVGSSSIAPFVVAPNAAPISAPVTSPIAAPISAPVTPPMAVPISAPVATPIAGPIAAPVTPPVAPSQTSNPTVYGTLLPTVTAEPSATYFPTFVFPPSLEPSHNKAMKGGMMMMMKTKKGKDQKSGKNMKEDKKKGPTGNVIFVNFDRKDMKPMNILLQNTWTGHGFGVR
jgi:trypsin